MKAHFVAAVKALDSWRPIPMEGDRRPKRVVIIWGNEGALEHDSASVVDGDGTASAPGDEVKRWLFEKRDDYGPAGWDVMTAGKVDCFLVGGNHFTMMKEPRVSQ